MTQTIQHMFSEVEKLKIFDLSLRDQHVSQQAILCLNFNTKFFAPHNLGKQCPNTPDLIN